MLFGYLIFSSDNKFHMNGNINLNECDRYSDTYTINRFDPNVKIKTKKNISCTYDNFTIVSEQFKLFCENGEYEGLEFVILPNSPGYYWFKIQTVIELDPEDRGIRFINYNEQCKGYEEIIGATPAYLKDKKLIPDGFFRSDICFGSFQNKFPLNIIGIETMKKIKAAGFKGIDFSEIKDKYD
jgi:hypothetical protein